MTQDQAQQHQIDLTRTGGALISQGVHPLVVSDVMEGEGKTAPYWLFEVTSQIKGEEGKTARVLVSLSSASRWRLEIFLNATGAPDEGKAVASQFIGRKFMGQVVHEKYEGRPQANVKDMWAVGAKTENVQPAAPVIVKKAEVAAPEPLAPAQPLAPPPSVEPVKPSIAPADPVLPPDTVKPEDEIPF